MNSTESDQPDSDKEKIYEICKALHESEDDSALFQAQSDAAETYYSDCSELKFWSCLTSTCLKRKTAAPEPAEKKQLKQANRELQMILIS